MGKVGLYISDDDFSLDATKEYNLSILIGIDRFFYLIYDKNNKVKAIRTYYFPSLKNFSQLNDSFLSSLYDDVNMDASYASVKILWTDCHSTLVPTELYTERDRALYLKSTTDFNGSARNVMEDDLNILDLKNIYAIHWETLNKMKSYFPKAKFFHCTSPLFFAYFKLVEQDTGSRVYANVMDRDLQLFFFRDKKLVFHNSYKFYSSQDFLYAVLLVYEQMNLKLKEVPLCISGDMVQDSEIYTLLYRYIQSIELLEKPTSYTLSDKFKDLPSNIFYELYNSNLCV